MSDEKKLQELYAAGYACGFADGMSSAPVYSRDDYLDEAGQVRSDEVEDMYDRVVEIVTAVMAHGGPAFEIELCDALRAKLLEWGTRTYVSPRQWAVLNKIERRLIAEGHMAAEEKESEMWSPTPSRT